ncbi:MAG: cytidylate kinase family protein [Desulfofustis sp.]|nr:cytidylate kinase family protein [Desulfofustis sp.]
MASIALFPCSFINGATIVGELSAQLGLTVYTDQLLLIDLAEKLGVSTEHLWRVLFGESSEQDRINLEKERSVNLCRSHLVEKLLSQPSKVLFYGRLAALFGPADTSVLRVLVGDSEEDRIRRAMREEGCSPERALAMIEKGDAELHAWTMFLHRKSPSDPSLYDLVIRYRSRDVFTIVDEIIRCYTEREALVQGSEATVALQNAALALAVERALLEDGYLAHIVTNNEGIELQVESSPFHFPWLAEALAQRALEVSGVDKVKISKKSHRFEPPQKQLAAWFPQIEVSV